MVKIHVPVHMRLWSVSWPHLFYLLFPVLHAKCDTRVTALWIAPIRYDNCPFSALCTPFYSSHLLRKYWVEKKKNKKNEVHCIQFFSRNATNIRSFFSLHNKEKKERKEEKENIRVRNLWKRVCTFSRVVSTWFTWTPAATFVYKTRILELVFFGMNIKKRGMTSKRVSFFWLLLQCWWVGEKKIKMSEENVTIEKSFSFR